MVDEAQPRDPTPADLTNMTDRQTLPDREYIAEQTAAVSEPAPPAIVAHSDFDPDDVDWLVPAQPEHVIIAEPDPAWPERFRGLEARIRDALGEAALAIEHVGSTSVPGMPAKPIIDIDLTVADSRDEGAYAAALEDAGFVFVLRERNWHEHRLFTNAEPRANIHVWGSDQAEAVRHRMLRDWLTEHADDRELYATAKRAAAAPTADDPELVQAYNQRKEPVIREILDRMFRAHGLL
ncbi:GrpB family protein [Schumannella luteola]|uniref:GrpB-like predicted nucleotidyltransferase (UPF0157 family) n=1 Tax=Schumannella luteola TaxID=472059 RepID=A0A852YD32_9MICO|nr:GrpB family protein [Schumannella luteola]NYG97537.1 GrpB-like predicted nucleotidyltransferase (UPF0157 family) [Schumannella luteola]